MVKGAAPAADAVAVAATPTTRQACRVAKRFARTGPAVWYPQPSALRRPTSARRASAVTAVPAVIGAMIAVMRVVTPSLVAAGAAPAVSAATEWTTVVHLTLFSLC